jgi:hypothetical protein
MGSDASFSSSYVDISLLSVFHMMRKDEMNFEQAITDADSHESLFHKMGPSP